MEAGCLQEAARAYTVSVGTPTTLPSARRAAAFWRLEALCESSKGHGGESSPVFLFVSCSRQFKQFKQFILEFIQRLDNS